MLACCPQCLTVIGVDSPGLRAGEAGRVGSDLSSRGFLLSALFLSLNWESGASQTCPAGTGVCVKHFVGEGGSTVISF